MANRFSFLFVSAIRSDDDDEACCCEYKQAHNISRKEWSAKKETKATMDKQASRRKGKLFKTLSTRKLYLLIEFIDCFVISQFVFPRIVQECKKVLNMEMLMMRLLSRKAPKGCEPDYWNLWLFPAVLGWKLHTKQFEDQRHVWWRFSLSRHLQNLQS